MQPDWIEVTATLTGGAVVTFEVTDTTTTDTPEQNPVEFFLRVLPSAAEEAPD